MPLGPEERAKRFTYHPPTGEKVARHENVRNEVAILAARLDTLLPDSREKSCAFTALEEALMWANAAVARNIS